MVNRYLFRKDVLIAKGNSSEYFHSIGQLDDLMLVEYESGGRERWCAYRMEKSAYRTHWDWAGLEVKDTHRLRTLLLLQQ